MSIEFNSQINPEAMEMLGKLFDSHISAMDNKTVLLKNMDVIKQSEMKQIVNAANQPAVLEINNIGEIKTMSDGTRYEVTKSGWKKLEV